MNSTTEFKGFADMDDLDTMPRTTAPKVETVPCIRCAGSGTFGYSRSLTCFACNGSGKITMAKRNRIQGARKATQTRADNLAVKRTAWTRDNATAYAWILAQSGKFEFATAMQGALDQYGSLTENQTAAVLRCVEKSAAKRLEWAREAEANKVQLDGNVSAVLVSLRKARDKGAKAPKLRAERLEFSLAKDASRNAGCAYVTADGVYLGKIDSSGIFSPTRDCSADDKARVVAIAANPLDAAIAYGRMTGNCACCGRLLENAESVRLGIGPICREKFF